MRQLGPLWRPVLAVVHVGLAGGMILAERFGIRDDTDGAFGTVGGDARLLLVTPYAEQAKSRNENDARQWVQHRPPHASASVVAREVGYIACDEFIRPLARLAPEIGEPTLRRCRHDQRPALGANGVIGCYHAGAGVAGELPAVDEGADRFVSAKLE